MKGRLWKIVTVCLVAAVAIGCAVLFLPMNQDTGASPQSSNMLSLVKPPFVSSVSAAGEDTNFLEEEAGISAYTNVGQTINLNQAKSAFRTVEYQTSEYIIGSVGIPGLPETEDVHCYVHKDGWVVSYYLREEPTAKIVDWNDLVSTKLEKGIGRVCDAAGVPFIQVTYYDFRYPNAEKLMLVIDRDSFNLKIPSSFAVYERSYSLYHNPSYSTVRLYIDGNEVAYASSEVVYGGLTPTQLTLDVFHTISLDHTGSHYGDTIALSYKEG
jgi:hypothetical protein